jgi:hypothetical protein
MGAPVLLKNAVDSYVNEKYPNTNYSNVDRIYLADNDLPDAKYGFIYFGLPSGLQRATVISAKLRLYNGPTGWAGTSTINVHKLDGPFSATKVTFNNKPAATGLAATLTKSSPTSGTLWEFDVTSTIQAVANGAPWYGLRLASSNNYGYLWSAQAPDQVRPQLEIVYTTAPYPPSDLVPTNGQITSLAKPTLSWDFRDVAGDVTMAQFQLRLFSSLALANANGTGDVLDTTVASSVPQVDLDDTAYGGLADGATVYWRVRVQDGAGLWSGWSPVGWFTRQAKGTLTLTNPPASPAEVMDATPTITWTFTGQTQRAYRVIITDPATPSRFLWDSGVVTSTANAVNVPAGIINTPGKSYFVIVHIADTHNRRSSPGDPTYVEATRTFTLSPSAATPPVTNLTGAADGFRAWYALEWDRTGSVDYFYILRDGVVVDEVTPAEVLVSGTHFRYVDRGASPRVNHTWSVAAKYDAIMSTSNPTVVGLVRLVTTHLSDVYGGHEVFLFNPNVQAARAESSEVHYPLGQASPVLITQALRGYEGTLAGVIVQDEVPGLTGRQQLANLEYFKDNPGEVIRISWVDKVFKGVLYNITDSPVPHPNGKVDHAVSASFFQTDFQVNY